MSISNIKIHEFCDEVWWLFYYIKVPPTKICVTWWRKKYIFRTWKVKFKVSSRHNCLHKRNGSDVCSILEKGRLGLQGESILFLKCQQSDSFMCTNWSWEIEFIKLDKSKRKTITFQWKLQLNFDWLSRKMTDKRLKMSKKRLLRWWLLDESAWWNCTLFKWPSNPW